MANKTEETEEFKENFSRAKTSSLLEGTLTLMAIEKINKKLLCLKWSHPMEVNQEKKVVKCGMYNVVNKLKLCKTSLYIEIIFKENDGLHLYNSSANEL